jgi:FG-GAP-like repeat
MGLDRAINHMLVLMVGAALVAACGGGSTATDAGVLDAVAPDAAPDAPSADATPDAPVPDAMPDAAPDASPDAMPDATPGPFTLHLTIGAGGWVEDTANGGGFGPPGIDRAYAGGTAVTLQPHDGGGVFSGFAGDCTGTDPCDLVMDRDRWVSATFSSCPGRSVWSRAGGGAGDDRGNAVAVDASGNVYVVGGFDTSATFGTTTLASAGATDVLVLAYAADGTLRWARAFGGPRFDQAYGVTVDPAGDVIVTGSFERVADFGLFQVSAPGPEGIFVAKLAAADGTPIWAHGYGAAAAGQRGLAVTTDGSGDAYVTGFFGGTVAFDSVVLSQYATPQGFGMGDVFVVKLASSDGVVQWGTRGGSIRHDAGAAIAIDPGSGDVLVTGEIADLAYFEGASVSAPPIDGHDFADVFWARFAAADGTLLDLHAFGGSDYDGGDSIAVDGAGGVVVFGSQDAQTVVVHFDATGTETWRTPLPLGYFPAGVRDAAGGLWVFGSYQNPITVAGTSFNGYQDSPLYDGMLVHLDAAGAADWAERVDLPGSGRMDRGSPDDRLTAIAAAPGGGVAIATSFLGSAGLCDGRVASAGGWDVAVARYGATAAADVPGTLLPPPAPVSPPGPSTCTAPPPPPSPLPAVKGAPTFTASTLALPGPSDPGRRAVGDFDHDGYDDLMVKRASATGGVGYTEVGVYRSTGTTLVDATDTIFAEPVYASPYAYVALDADGDHRTDAVISNNTYDDRWGWSLSIDLLHQQSDGTMRQEGLTRLPHDESLTEFVHAGDVDCDGDVDVYVMSQPSFRKTPSRLLVNDGTGHFTPEERQRLPADYFTNDQTAALTMCDVDADGDPDLIYPGQVLVNDGTGHFTAAPSPIPWPTADGTYKIFCADFDLDGANDLLVETIEGPDYGLVLLHNAGDGTFVLPSPQHLAYTASPRDVAIADVNADGWPDIVSTPNDHSSQLLVNAGDGTFAELLDTLAPADSSSHALVSIDIDHDDRVDLVLFVDGVATTLFHNQTP